MSVKLMVLLAVITGSSVAWAVHERDLRIEQRAIAAVHAQRVDSIRGAVVEARLEATTTQAELVATRATLAEERLRSDSIVAVERARRPALVDTIVLEAGPDSTVVREAIERVSASYESEISALTRATAAAEATMRAQHERILALSAVVNTQESLIANLDAQLQAQRGTSPGFFERTVGKAVLAVGSAGLGYWIGTR